MFIDGRLDLITPNTPTPLVPPANNGPARRITNITLQAPSTNAASVFVGGSGVVSTPAGSTTGIELIPGATESFSVTDAADIFVAGPAAAVLRFRAKAI
jgi:hypothetical protein